MSEVGVYCVYRGYNFSKIEKQENQRKGKNICLQMMGIDSLNRRKAKWRNENMIVYLKALRSL